MGMGFASGYADVISPENLKKICPKTYTVFETALANAKLDIQTYATHNDDDDELVDLIQSESDKEECDEKEAKGLLDRINDAFANLKADFEFNTTVQDSYLELSLGYHDIESGDRYDEVEGAFFAVEGVYGLTPAGKVFSDVIERCNFVMYG